MKTTGLNPILCTDGIIKHFNEELDFYNFLEERHENSRWRKFPTNELSFVALEEGERETEAYRLEFQKAGNEFLFLDTMEESALMARLGDEVIPIRKCAMEGVLERLGISGQGLKRLPKKEWEQVLNMLSNHAEGYTKTYENDGKISGVHSGNEYAYSKIPAFDLFKNLMILLYVHVPENTFIAGRYQHHIVEGTWLIEGMDEKFEEFYTPFYTVAKEPPTPYLHALTSDTGAACITFSTGFFYEENQQFLPVGNPIKTIHRNQKTMHDVEINFRKAFVKLQESSGILGSLLEIPLKSPVDVMERAAKEARLPIRRTNEAMDLYYNKLRIGTAGRTAYDVYRELSQAVYRNDDKEPVFHQMQMQENILRLLHADWNKWASL